MATKEEVVVGWCIFLCTTLRLVSGTQATEKQGGRQISKSESGGKIAKVAKITLPKGVGEWEKW